MESNCTCFFCYLIFFINLYIGLRFNHVDADYWFIYFLLLYQKTTFMNMPKLNNFTIKKYKYKPSCPYSLVYSYTIHTQIIHSICARRLLCASSCMTPEVEKKTLIPHVKA